MAVYARASNAGKQHAHIKARNVGGDDASNLRGSVIVVIRGRRRSMMVGLVMRRWLLRNNGFD
jgi:hypothetical protein